MRRRPLIGLTVGPEPNQPAYLRIRASYIQAIEAAGGLPVLIPPLEHTDGLHALLDALDGIVLPGGLDVDPAYYGQAPHPTTEVNAVLDRLELDVARWAAASEMPTLAICRGQQVLNVACGGTLIQHLEGHRQHEQGLPRDAPSHPIHVRDDSRLAEIFGATEFRVNSHHHQAVAADGVAPGLRAVGWSPDGVVEALEGERHPWLLAVQFHPEELVGFHAPSQRLFQALVEAAIQRRARAGVP